MKKNISIIGMAGVGKSFTAKRLADDLHYQNIEVDTIITDETKKIGVDKNTLPDTNFTELEEKAVLSLRDIHNAIIDTGGSVIYSPKAMETLKTISFVVYLSDSLEEIKKRFDARGQSHLIGMTAGMTFDGLLSERETLYEKYADMKIDVSEHKDALISKIINEYSGS